MVIPAKSLNLGRRMDWLSRERDFYRWTDLLLPGVPMSSSLSVRDRPCAEWYGKCMVHRGRVRVNTELCARRDVRLEGRPRSIADYNRQFQAIALPWVAGYLFEDSAFAYLRVAGFNPFSLAALREPFPESLRLTDAHLAQAPGFEGERLDALRGEGRLFALDFRDLCRAGSGPAPGKRVLSPFAVFGVTRGRRRLAPIAIQCEPRADAPIFTPADGWGWRMAQTLVNCADINLQQPTAHGFSHLFCGVMCVAAKRQLSEAHPLTTLLMPHFEGTLFINDMAARELLAFGTLVDDIMVGPIPSIQAIARAYLLDRPVYERFLPADLKARGVEDPERLPDFPFRDDALAIRGAIRGWVEGYLRLYYKDDRAVRGDWEVRAWLDDAQSPQGGRLKGLFPPGVELGVASLAELVTAILFKASAQHAATNFSQGPLFSYTPVAPMAIWGQIPDRIHGWTSQDWLDLLPPLERSYQQLELGYRLYATQHTRLGHYARGHFRDRRVWPLAKAFRAQLDHIGGQIAERNRERLFPYPFLIPANVPQSVNI